jgi:lipopolysaccharide biosynthesis protein
MKAIAFYLPQFHPIPENDTWWGAGFTEWTNVAKARPLFRGHYQPHIPADLGFYDLRLRDTRVAQAEMAKRYGISGFCYYHYWFNGKLLLEKPAQAMLADHQPDFPFCYCWANETWSRRWDGQEHEVLLAQDPLSYDPRAHLSYLADSFRDRRYIHVDGRPLFLVYRIDQLPDIAATVKSWRDAAANQGLPGLYICAVRSHMHLLSESETIALGFDGVVAFEPHSQTLPPQGLATRLRYFFPRAFNFALRRLGVRHIRELSVLHIFDYRALVRIAMQAARTTVRTFPCATPSWDNSARRRSGATVIQNDDPRLFESWLRDCVERVKDFPEDEQLVFINAWNEWAEGCHLEPDRRHGHGFLEAVSRVFGGPASSIGDASGSQRKLHG